MSHSETNQLQNKPTFARRFNATQVRQFIADASDNGIDSFSIADFKLSRELRVTEMRSKRVQGSEGHGTPAWAYGYDELGNVIALCGDGTVRSFTGDY